MTTLRKPQVALTSKAAPFAIRAERAVDVTMREALLDVCFGGNRHDRTCQRLRDGRAPAAGLALAAVREGELVGTVRLWHVSAGGRPALVLGPLAVDPACRELGIGAALMQQALAAARARGHGAVILLGDAPTTLASASRRRRPARWCCPARSSATACWRSNSSTVCLTAPKE